MSSDEPFALSTMAESAPPAEAEYEAICTAFMETQRGRWFLAEYARRNRNTDTKLVLDAISRIEDAVQAGSAAQSTDRFRSALTDMAQAIARTKADIAALRPEAEHHGKIGEASEELDLIVDATARATSEILAAAEHIQEAAWTMREQGIDSRFCDELDAKATEIYTACSFQDITGQRTHKVVQVLRYLEGRIHALIDIWGSFSATPGPAASAAAQEDTGAPRHDAPPHEAAAAEDDGGRSGSIIMEPATHAAAADQAAAPEPATAEAHGSDAMADTMAHPDDAGTRTSSESASLADAGAEPEPLVSMLETAPVSGMQHIEAEDTPLPAETSGEPAGVERMATDTVAEADAEAEAGSLLTEAPAAIAPPSDAVAGPEATLAAPEQAPEEVPSGLDADAAAPEVAAVGAADAVGAVQTGEAELEPAPAETTQAESGIPHAPQSAAPEPAITADGVSHAPAAPEPPATTADAPFTVQSEEIESVTAATGSAAETPSSLDIGAPPSAGPEMPAAAHGDAAPARADTSDDLAALPKGAVAAQPGAIPSTLAWLLGGDMVGSDAVTPTAAEAPTAPQEAAQAAPEPDLPPAIGLPADIFATEPSERLAVLLAEVLPEPPEEPAPSPAPHLAGLPDIDFGVAPLRPLPAPEPRRTAAFLAPAALALSPAAPAASPLQLRWTQSNNPAAASDAASGGAPARPRATELDPAEFLFEPAKVSAVPLAAAQGGVPLQAVNGGTRHDGEKPATAGPEASAPQGRVHAADRGQRDPLGAIMALTQDEKIALFG